MNEESDTDLTKLEPLSPWETFTEFWEKDKNLSREAWKNFFLHHHLLEVGLTAEVVCSLTLVSCSLQLGPVHTGASTHPKFVSDKQLVPCHFLICLAFPWKHLWAHVRSRSPSTLQWADQGFRLQHEDLHNLWVHTDQIIQVCRSSARCLNKHFSYSC